jgi:hypothetical protein
MYWKIIVMRKNISNEKTLKNVARNIFWFHVVWIFVIILGTVVQCFYPPYAKVQIVIVLITFIFQILGNGHCPLTLFENLVLKECAPEKMYCDKQTFDVSFVRHYMKKHLGITAPKGTTTTLLAVSLVLTIFLFINQII